MLTWNCCLSDATTLCPSAQRNEQTSVQALVPIHTSICKSLSLPNCFTAASFVHLKKMTMKTVFSFAPYCICSTIL